MGTVMTAGFERPWSARGLVTHLAWIIAVCVLSALLPAGLTAPAAAATRPGDLPTDSVEVPYTIEVADQTWTWWFDNYHYWNWMAVCRTDLVADVDLSRGRYNPEDGTYSFMRNDGGGNASYEVRFSASEPNVLTSATGTFRVLAEGRRDSMTPGEDVELCGEEPVNRAYDHLTATTTLWTMGTRALEAGFTSEVSEEVPGQVRFTSTTTTTYPLEEVEHVWNFGDGHSSTERNPVHTYAKPGSYDVTLTTRHEQEEDSLTRQVELAAPELKLDWLIDGKAVDDQPVVLNVGQAYDVTLRVWSTFGLGPLTEVKPSGDPVDFPDSFTVSDASEVPEAGFALEPVSSRAFTWTVEPTAEGGGTLSADWAGMDAAEQAVEVSSTLDYTSPPLAVALTQVPDPLLLDIDNDQDGDVDDDDNRFRVVLSVRNVTSSALTEVRAQGSGRTPISISLSDDMMGPKAEGTHPFDLGDLAAGETKEFEYPFLAGSTFSGPAKVDVVAQSPSGPVSVVARTKMRAVKGQMLDVDLEPERTSVVSGQPLRFRGTLENLSRIEDGDEVVEEGSPIGVVLYPKIEGNAGAGFVTPSDYGGRSPAAPVEFIVPAGEEVEVSGFFSTQSLPTASNATVSFEIGAWLMDEEEEFPVRLAKDEIESHHSDGWSTRPRFFSLAADPPIADPWLSCSHQEQVFTGYVSCRLTVGGHKFVTGLYGLGKMVGTGLWTMGDAGVRIVAHSIWMQERALRAVLGDRQAMDALVTDVVINLQALQAVGVESLHGVALTAANIEPKVRTAINDALAVLETGDIEQIAGGLAQKLGENLDMPLEALVRARALAIAINHTTDSTSHAARALQKEMDDQAASLSRRVEDALNTGGVAKLTKGSVLKSGDRLTGVPAAWKAMGLTYTDLRNVLKIAEQAGVMLAFRPRSSRAGQLIEDGLAWQKSGDIALKTVNDLDRKYLDYPDDWDGTVVLVEPPVDWTLTGSAREAAIEAYLDKFGQLTSPSDFSRDLRAQVRERLELRMDEYPQGMQSYSKYLSEGIDGNFHIEKQGLPENVMPNNEPAWAAKVEVESIPAGAAGNPERRVFTLQMAPPNSTDFRPITGDVDFIGVFSLDGKVVEDVLVRTQIYKALRHSMGMQHGETITFSVDAAKQRNWLSAHVEGGETLMIANADGHLYASHLNEGLSALDWNPNSQYMANGGRPFVFLDGMIVAADNTVKLPPTFSGPTWRDRMKEFHAAYKKYDPKKIMEAVQAAEKQKDKETFEKTLGRLFRLDTQGELLEYKRLHGDSAAPSRDARAAGGAAPADLPPELASELQKAIDLGMVLDDVGKAGGQWVPVALDEALVDGRLPLTPMTYLSEDVPAGSHQLPVLGLDQLRMDPGTGFLAVGDEIVIDPAGAHEQFATVTGTNPVTLDVDVADNLPAMTQIAVLSDLMRGVTPPPQPDPPGPTPPGPTPPGPTPPGPTPPLPPGPTQPPALVIKNLAKPRIKGKPRTGKVLKATRGKWSSATGVKFRFQWFAGSKKIRKATRARLKLTRKLRGKRISVRVTAILPDGSRVVVRSKRTRKVR